MSSDIILLSNDEIKPEFIKNLIVDSYPDCIIYTSAIEAASKLNADTRYLFLYCYNNNEQADQARLELFMNSNGLVNIHHKSILLCADSESESAYNLCHEMLFDFFITASPIFNRYELLLYLDRNIKQLMLEDKLMTITESITLFDQPSRSEQQSNKESNSVQNLEIESFEDNLNQDMTEFSEYLDSERYQPILEVKNSEAFKSSFNTDVRSIIHKRVTDLDRLTSKNKKTILKEYLDNHDNEGKQKQQSPVVPNNNIILIIENDLEISNELSDILVRNNFTVLQSSNGRAALAKMLNNMPALIIINHQLSNTETSSFIRMGKIMHNRSMPPVLAYTSNTNENVASILNLGAAGVVSQPFQTESLLEKIETVLSGS